MKIQQEEQGVMVVKGWKEEMICGGRRWRGGVRERREVARSSCILFYMLK